MIRQKVFSIVAVLLMGMATVWAGGVTAPQATALAQTEEASVQVIPGTVAQNTTVKIRLSGFRPEEVVTVWQTLPGPDPQISNGPTHSIGNYKVSLQGDLTFSWHVAGTNPIGVHVIGARGNKSLREASTPFTVTAGNVQHRGDVIDMSIDAPVVHQGQTLKISAMGFKPGERIGVWITRPDGSVKELGQAIASQEGVMDFEFTPDGSYAVGIYHLSAQGTKSGVLSVTRLQIVGGRGDMPQTEVKTPRLTITPSTAQKGGKIKIEGQNFGSDEDVSIWTTSASGQTVHNLGSVSDDDGRHPLKVHTEEDGFFVKVIDLPPELPTGRHVVTARGHMSGLNVEAEFTILP